MSSKKKRPKWKTTDPTEIAPNFYHEDLFVANFPLVDLVKVPVRVPFPVRDKFEGPMLQETQTFEARKKWVRRLCEVSCTFRAPENEKQAFPHHFGLIEALKCFTKPSRIEVEKQNECVRKKRKWSFEEADVKPKTGAHDIEENTGLQIVTEIGEVQDPLGHGGHSSANAGLEVVPEETAEFTAELEEDDDLPTGFADGALHVYDDRSLKRQKLGGGGSGLVDTNKVAAILERKFKEDKTKDRAAYQGGFYAAKHAMMNIQKGHGTPVYVVVMTLSMWSYAQFVPEGFVQVRDGQIDEASMVQFAHHQHITGNHQFDFQKLQAKLAAGTTFYRKNYKDNPSACYRDGPMPVGTYYVSSEWFPLPKADSGGAKSAGVRRLFDGLMRVIAGDSVLSLTEEGYRARFRVWDEMMDELAEDAMY